MKKSTSPKPTEGYGYVSQWTDGSLGWFLPLHIHSADSRKRAAPINSKARSYLHGNNKRFVLCKITVKPILNKAGKPIIKIAK